MVFKKLVSLFYNFIGLRGRRPIKETSSSSCHEVIESGFIEKRWADDSPAGWGGVGGEGVEVEDTLDSPHTHKTHHLTRGSYMSTCLHVARKSGMGQTHIKLLS
ncbi:hypothetical protein L1049_025195 [Liquidambar formosana]|uniref:Uncharacterized protein n=1 Tax=Liquidambar formosana TaxID=63359 RepID=A0AAP0S284_LIQFO